MKPRHTVNSISKTLSLALAFGVVFSALVASGCSTTITPPLGSEQAEHAKRWCNGQATITIHTYVWGSHADRNCTDANGNTTTTRMLSNGLYD